MGNALRLFAERGFQETTVEDITEAADVGKGTFFNYFPTKEHIFAVHARMQVERLREILARATGSDRPIEQFLDDLASLGEKPGISTPAMFRGLFATILLSESVLGLLMDGIEQGQKSLADLMLLGQERGEIREDLTPSELALQVHRTAIGAMLLWTLTPSEPLSDTLRETFRVLWPLIRSQKGK
jgi:AcrR family transcriptional regulator